MVYLDRVAENHVLADAIRSPMLWVLAEVYFVSQVSVYTGVA